MQRFKSPGQAQRFLSACGPIAQHFRPCRHRFAAPAYRQELRTRFQVGRRSQHQPWPHSTCAEPILTLSLPNVVIVFNKLTTPLGVVFHSACWGHPQRPIHYQEIQNNGPRTSTLISPPLIAGASIFISSMRCVLVSRPNAAWKASLASSVQRLAAIAPCTTSAAL